MADSPRNLLPLWDYGWLDYEEVAIQSSQSIDDVILSYLQSKAFCTSFVGQKKQYDEGIHGPFRQKSVTLQDFLQIDRNRLWDEVNSIRQPDGFRLPATDQQWQAVERIITRLEENNSWVIMLTLTERDEEKFHDWGFVLIVFREFLFANPLSNRISRVVFGFD